MARSRLRRPGMLPAFLIAGTRRGGTTALYQWVTRHPQVARCRVEKGTHYFDVNHHRGWHWYRTCFPEPSAAGDAITGEASPYYMFHPRSAEWISTELPDTRLVVLLRDPVARAHSEHQYELARGNETRSFRQAIVAEHEQLVRAGTQPDLTMDLGRKHHYLARGHYAEQLERLFTFVDPARMLLLRSEQMYADPQTVLDRVWTFLGLDPVPLHDVAPVKSARYSEALAPETERWLRAYYEPHNEALKRLTGIDLGAPLLPEATS